MQLQPKMMQAVNEDSDDDYDSEIQDQGRNALFLLLDAAANLLDADAANR